jgi:hypothetical protein
VGRLQAALSCIRMDLVIGNTGMMLSLESSKEVSMDVSCSLIEEREVAWRRREYREHPRSNSSFAGLKLDANKVGPIFENGLLIPKRIHGIFLSFSMVNWEELSGKLYSVK